MAEAEKVCIEIEPELFACIEVKTKRRYQRLLSQVLSKGESGELGTKLEILGLFIESADFGRLRGEYEKHLVAGKRVKFSLYLDRGQAAYDIQIT
ncbi:hypothetical protein ACFLWY_01610 [Chloroflexota bacterium]